MKRIIFFSILFLTTPGFGNVLSNETCTKANRYLETSLPEVEGPLERAFEAPDPSCILAAQDSYAVDDGYTFCSKPIGVPRDNRPRPCLSKKYQAWVYQSYIHATRCMGVDSRDLFPLISLESGFHINSVGPGKDAGVAQLTQSGIAGVNRDYERFAKEIRESKDPDCIWIARFLHKIDSSVRQRCEAVHLPENPALSFVYASQLYKDNFNAAAIGVRRYGGKIPAEVDTPLLTMGLADIGYNGGIGNALAAFRTYLKVKRSKVKDSDFDFRSEAPGTFVAFMLKHYPAPKGYEKIRSSAPKYMKWVLNYGFDMEAAVGPGMCLNSKTLGGLK